MVDNEDESGKAVTTSLSARETAEMIELFARLISHSELKSEKVAVSLAHVVRILKKFGDHPIDLFRATPAYKTLGSRPTVNRATYRDITLEEARNLIMDEKTTRPQIARLALERFGIPQSRLSRGRLDEAIEIVKAAIDHEMSLQFISASAERTGHQRKS